MPTPISGQNGTYIPPLPGTSPTTPGLLRPSDLTGGGPIPNGPQGLTGRPPSFLSKPNTAPPRRNVLPNMHATQHRGGGDEPPLGYPSSTPPPGGHPPPLAQAALGAADTAGNDAIASQNAMMAQMQQMNLMSIQQQMQMAQMESIKSMATALAKTIKGIGKGVADLAS